MIENVQFWVWQTIKVFKDTRLKSLCESFQGKNNFENIYGALIDD